MSLNGKVSHRNLGKAVADLTETVNHNAHALNNQGRMLKAYGERLADALLQIEQLKKELAGLKAQYGRVELGELRIEHVTEEQPV